MNAANEITGISGSGNRIDAEYDNAANMIRVPKLDGSGGYFLVQYHAWNRMTGVYEDSDEDGELDLGGENPDQPLALYRYVCPCQLAGLDRFWP